MAKRWNLREKRPFEGLLTACRRKRSMVAYRRRLSAITCISRIFIILLSHKFPLFLIFRSNFLSIRTILHFIIGVSSLNIFLLYQISFVLISIILFDLDEFRLPARAIPRTAFLSQPLLHC